MAQIRVAMIGTGGIAGKHVPTMLAHPRVELVAGCDVTTAQVEAFWTRVLPAGMAPPPAYTDLEAMYAAVKPDAVIICTPHTLHFEQAMQALDHGCHVLLEKPMVTHAEHACALKAKVDATGTVFTIAYNTPCSPEVGYLRDLIRSGELGKLELVSGFLSQDWLRLTVGKWRQDPALSGGGQAYDSGAHPLCTLTWSVESDIEEVFAWVDNHGSPVDINSVMCIRFANGVMASMTVSGNCPSNGSFMTFIFDAGRVEIDPWGASYIKVWKGAELVKYPPITAPRTAPVDNFIAAILGEAEPRTSPANGVVHSELMDAIYESARTGKPASPARRNP